MKRFFSLTFTVILMIAAVFSAAAWEYDDFPQFPESDKRSPKLPAAALLTASDTPLGAFAEPDAEVVSFLFYDEKFVAENSDLPLQEFSVCHYGENQGNYSCIVMSYYAQHAYEVTFTVAESGLYAFRFDCVSDDSGRGAYLQIDDGVYYDAYLQRTWPEAVSMYGMLAELTAGEHTMKLYGHETKPTYAQGFAYTLAEARDVVTEPVTEEITDTPTEAVDTSAPDTQPQANGSGSTSWGMYALATVWILAAVSVICAVIVAHKRK